ncbi:zf-TFIIB domain-containing protein [Dehalobacter sp. DCM]|uniref:TFIIB-type zinc ribbon-containing protein n=1 Tax=Dehalobacter sp. DCM TaxID=2907827 RepID=UPI0030814033|nr:zf-TFIIB domain-containing protein [Dehalobacter sp. DCM]
MDCPICHVNLQMTERQGIEIDYCPQCRGIWLDRGELDKIIERSKTDDSFHEPNFKQPAYNDKPYDKQYDHRDVHHNSYYGGYPKHKKKSFLSELFEFGDD